MTITPNALHQQAISRMREQIIGGLIDTKPITWKRKTLIPNPVDPDKPTIREDKIQGRELRYPLARNVSETNVNRTAQRWI